MSNIRGITNFLRKSGNLVANNKMERVPLLSKLLSASKLQSGNIYFCNLIHRLQKINKCCSDII